MSEEQLTMKETVARLMKGMVADKAHDMDEKKSIPSELSRRYGSWG